MLMRCLSWLRFRTTVWVHYDSYAIALACPEHIGDGGKQEVKLAGADDPSCREVYPQANPMVFVRLRFWNFPKSLGDPRSHRWENRGLCVHGLSAEHLQVGLQVVPHHLPRFAMALLESKNNFGLILISKFKLSFRVVSPIGDRLWSSYLWKLLPSHYVTIVSHTISIPLWV